MRSKKRILNFIIVLFASIVLFFCDYAMAEIYNADIQATGNISIMNVNTVTGIFDVVISDVSSTEEIEKIEVPV
ncbi:MAG: hypothetical protein IJ958_02825 [Agathobacter sp.]|nr:hypothetical protein [Agathobacter sp.]